MGFWGLLGHYRNSSGPKRGQLHDLRPPWGRRDDGRYCYHVTEILLDVLPKVCVYDSRHLPIVQQPIWMASGEGRVGSISRMRSRGKLAVLALAYVRISVAESLKCPSKAECSSDVTSASRVTWWPSRSRHCTSCRVSRSSDNARTQASQGGFQKLDVASHSASNVA